MSEIFVNKRVIIKPITSYEGVLEGQCYAPKLKSSRDPLHSTPPPPPPPLPFTYSVMSGKLLKTIARQIKEDMNMINKDIPAVLLDISKGSEEF